MFTVCVYVLLWLSEVEKTTGALKLRVAFMVKQITEQMLLPFRALKKLTAKALCALRGHRYSSPVLYFDNYHLHFCTCCGDEIFGRDFSDILPIPDEHDFWDDF